MRFRRFVRQAHRWLGLLIGVQVLLWISGGAIMSMLRLEEVRGEHLAAKHAASSSATSETTPSFALTTTEGAPETSAWR